MRKVWRLFFLRSSKVRYKQDYQSEILKWCGNSCGIDPWSDKGTVDLYARVYVSRGIKNVCVVVRAMEIPFSERRILHSYSWLGQCREIGKLRRFYFWLNNNFNNTYLCVVGTIQSANFFGNYLPFEDGPLPSIGWISLFRILVLVHLTIPCRYHLYHTLPIYLLCLPRKGGLDAFL